MADPLLTFRQVQHRHRVPAPKPWKPWAKRLGAGIVGLNLDLHSGSVLGLVGPNGAGKTTLLHMLKDERLSQHNPTQHPSTSSRAHEVVRSQWV